MCIAAAVFDAVTNEAKLYGRETSTFFKNPDVLKISFLTEVNLPKKAKWNGRMAAIKWPFIKNSGAIVELYKLKIKRLMNEEKHWIPQQFRVIQDSSGLD